MGIEEYVHINFPSFKRANSYPFFDSVIPTYTILQAFLHFSVCELLE